MNAIFISRMDTDLLPTIKESLSKIFVGGIASRQGYSLSYPTNDNGIDLKIEKIAVRTESSGKKSFVDNGNPMDIQLKSTTERGVQRTSDFIKYKLKVKNYNDLITRKANGITPLILCLFILPVDETEWLQINDEDFTLRKNAYWFEIDSVTPSTNTGSVTINIPVENKLSLAAIDNLYESYYN